MESRAIDTLRDNLRPVEEIVEARTGKRPTSTQCWRWRKQGCNGVRLQCVPLGRKWLTSEAAFAEFIDRQAAARETAGV